MMIRNNGIKQILDTVILLGKFNVKNLQMKTSNSFQKRIEGTTEISIAVPSPLN